MSKFDVRIFRYQTVNGEKSIKLWPEHFIAARLIAQLADGCLGYIRSADLRPDTVQFYFSSIRTLGKQLTNREDRSLSLLKSRGEVEARIDEIYEHSLAFGAANRKTVIHKLSNVKTSAEYYLVDNQIDDPMLLNWCKAPMRDWKSQRNVPLDEYSNSERILLRDYCRSLVRAGEKMLEIGAALLLDGRDSEISTTTSLPDAVWKLRNDPHFEATWQPNVSYPSEFWPELASRGYSVDRLKPYVVGKPTYALVLPTLEHLTALRILIHLAVDWPPEETRQLLRSDVVFESDQVVVSTAKHRAHRYRQRILSSVEREELGWSAGDLFRRVKNATSFGWEFGDESTPFWLGSLMRKSRGSSRNAGILPRWIGTLAASHTGDMASFIARGGLEISAPHSFRRLRKTTKSIRALKSGSISLSAGDDHTTQVFWNHYAPTTSVMTSVAASVLGAQEFVTERIQPQVFSSSAAKVLEDSEDPELVNAAKYVVNESEVDKHFAVSSCNSNGTNGQRDEQEACMLPMSACISCKNAFYFRDHAPRLVFYLQVLESKRNDLTPIEFERIYGSHLRQLIGLLGRFTREVLESAAKEPVRLELPITRIGR